MSDKPKYRYQSARETAEKMQSGFESSTLKLPDGVSQFKLKAAGTVKLDIVPFITAEGNPYADPGVPYWERTYYAHRNVGPNEQMVICLARTLNKPCPVCEWRAKMAKSSGASDDELKSLNPKRRQLFCVMDPTEPDKGVQVWDMSYHLFGRLLNERLAEAEEDSGWEYFYHPSKGMRLRLTIREETMGKHKFFEVAAIDFIPRKAPLEIDIAESPCLDEILRLQSYDKLKALLDQTPTGDDEAADDEDADLPPPRKKAAAAEDDEDLPPPRKKKVADDDEDLPKKAVADDDDDEDPPKSKKAKAAVEEEEEDEDLPKRKKSAPVEEDPDLDAEPDEDLPAPKKKAAAVEDDEDEDLPKSKKGKAPVEEEEDEDLPKKSKPAVDEDEDEDLPKSKKEKSAEDWDEDLPKKKKKSAEAEDDEDEDLPAAKKRKAAVDDDE